MLYYRDFIMKRLFTALFTVVAISTLLAGCGQKGPLFLPEESQPVPAQAEPAAEPAQTE
ncbi:MAG: lipoprotein [Pseudomonas sp.]|uniref:LPS translocon maturation chaperone LptM n=1 Tax=Pseudomonas sp. TaxID=306 RepID=UPI003982077D